jgi:hypothetical protein
MRKMCNACKVVVGKTEGMRPLMRPVSSTLNIEAVGSSEISGNNLQYYVV